MSEDRQDKNQLFSAPQHAASAPRTGEIIFDVPVDAVPLPSQGKVYPPGHTLSGVDVVEITSMTTREEDILTSAALLKKGTVITELIRSCLVDKNIDPTDLLAGDRNALMVAIRITGYGAEYDGEVTCDECNKTTARTFDLSSLQIKRLEIDPVVPNQNVFEYKLPKSGNVVRFRFLTGKVEEEINVLQERQKKILNTQKDTFVSTNLLYAILSVNGVEDRGQISKFVNTMSAFDSQALRKYMRNNEPGIDMKQESECPCGYRSEVTMPLSSTFLWPNAE